MRVAVAVLVLLVGGALGYGWHEAAPRVLGSAPFCGPKYPGMLRSIPEDEYFPVQEEVPQVFINDESDDEPESDDYRTYAEMMTSIGEPSLWHLSQHNTTAFRLISSSYVGASLAQETVRGTFHPTGAMIDSKFAIFDHVGSLEHLDHRTYELNAEQAAALRVAVVEPRFRTTPEYVWSQCSSLPEDLDMLLGADFEQMFVIRHGHGTTITLELVEPGRFNSVTQRSPEEFSWLYELRENLLTHAPPVSDGAEAHSWMYVPEALRTLDERSAD